MRYGRNIPEDERKRSRKLFYTTNGEGSVDEILAWEYVSDARRFCAVLPSVRRLLSGKHPAVRRAKRVRKGNMRKVEINSPEMKESRSLLEVVLAHRFRPSDE